MPPKREGDAEDYDPRLYRHWRGPSRPEDFINGSEVKVGWGDKALALKGPMVITVVLLVALGALGFYIHTVQQREHAAQLKATNVNLCVSLYDFQERKQFREAWRNDPKTPRYWCPNLIDGW